MKNKNTVYTVTPPDIRLNTVGPNVLVLGADMETSRPFIDIYDKLFPDVEITFFVGDTGFAPQHAAWYRAMAGMVGTIFVNLDNITTEELLMAVQASQVSHQIVFWVSPEKTNPTLIAMLNSYQYQIFNSLDEVEKFLLDEFDKN